MVDADPTSAAHSALRGPLEALCRGVALLGGAALVATMLVVVASVTSAQFGAPILGDTEIVDLSTGVVVFCFLPYCYLHSGNVIVDFFTRPLPRRANDALDALMHLVFTVVACVLTWRLIAGGISAYQREQRSMFLALPEWHVYALGSAVSLLWIVVVVFVAWESAMRASGRLAAPAPDSNQFG